jgi:xanthine dehydrogenase small subunit
MSPEFLLNGRPVRAEGCSPQTTLLDFLRSRGLTGAKEGCAEGECGACTVAMVRPRGDGSAYVPVNSCLLLLPMVAGHEIVTVEALADGGAMAPVQQAIAEAGGSQCGYCTPGFVMSLFAEQYRPGRSGPCDPHAMSGNLCRCTGYRPIRDAALSLGDPPAGALLDRLRVPAPDPGSASFAGFARPGTLAECVVLLAEHPEARLIAGGTDLAVESNLKGKRFPYLISVDALRELRDFHETADGIEIGAGLTLSEIELPHRWWDEWRTLFASPLIRNRATLGGNLATASPIGDAAPLLLALGAEVRIVGAAGERTVPLDRFFLAYRETELAPGELLVSVRIPKPLPDVVRFYKVAKRRMDDISTVAACFTLRAGALRMAFGGVAAIPVLVHEGETLHPIGDHRGSAAYRLAMTESLLAKFRYEAA